MQYKEWLNEWLECYVKPTTKSKTYIRYSEIVYGHIIPKIGSYDICELTPLILQRFVTDLLSGGNLRTGVGLSSNSVNGIINRNIYGIANLFYAEIAFVEMFVDVSTSKAYINVSFDRFIRCVTAFNYGKKQVEKFYVIFDVEIIAFFIVIPPF